MRLLPLALTLALALPCPAADWPQFRGPGGTGASSETGLPTGFTENGGLRWKAALPGRGLSSPVVVGGRVYITCNSGPREERLHVLCFSAGTGTQLWHRQLAATGGTACHPKTCMAAPSPAADDTGVYALFATGDLAAFDKDGNLKWYRSLVGDYPTLSNQVGMAASPILRDGKLVVPMDNAGESFLAALDPQTGKNLWKVARPRKINWATPSVHTSGGKTDLLVGGPDGLVAYDLDSGAKRWTITNGGGIPSPTVIDDLLITPGGETAGLKLVEGGTKEAWKSPKLKIGTASPVVYDGRVYVAQSAGLVVCADAKTGTMLWQERVKGPFSASPVAGDGKVYVLSETGVLTALKAGAEAEILAESKTGEEGLATPAISGGAVFVRGDKTLFCIGSKLGG